MPPKSKFVIGEKVLCLHGNLLYEAKLLEIEKKGSKMRYFIHYTGWKRNWDEWIPESKVLKLNKTNLKKQIELINLHVKSKKSAKKMLAVSKNVRKECKASSSAQEKLPKQKVIVKKIVSNKYKPPDRKTKCYKKKNDTVDVQTQIGKERETSSVQEKFPKKEVVAKNRTTNKPKTSKEETECLYKTKNYTVDVPPDLAKECETSYVQDKFPKKVVVKEENYAVDVPTALFKECETSSAQEKFPKKDIVAKDKNDTVDIETELVKECETSSSVQEKFPKKVVAKEKNYTVGDRTDLVKECETSLSVQEKFPKKEVVAKEKNYTLYLPTDLFEECETSSSVQEKFPQKDVVAKNSATNKPRSSKEETERSTETEQKQLPETDKNSLKLNECKEEGISDRCEDEKKIELEDLSEEKEVASKDSTTNKPKSFKEETECSPQTEQNQLPETDKKSLKLNECKEEGISDKCDDEKKIELEDLSQENQDSDEPQYPGVTNINPSIEEDKPEEEMEFKAEKIKEDDEENFFEECEEEGEENFSEECEREEEGHFCEKCEEGEAENFSEECEEAEAENLTEECEEGEEEHFCEKCEEAEAENFSEEYEEEEAENFSEEYEEEEEENFSEECEEEEEMSEEDDNESEMLARSRHAATDYPLWCRSIRIGSYNFHPQPTVPYLAVTLAKNSLSFNAPIISDPSSRQVHITLRVEDVHKMYIHFGRSLPVIFINTTPKFGELLRNALHMTENETPYFDPLAKDERTQKLIFLIDSMTEDQKTFLKNFPGDHKLFEVDQKTATEILVKSTPNQQGFQIDKQKEIEIHEKFEIQEEIEIHEEFEIQEETEIKEETEVEEKIEIPTALVDFICTDFYLINRENMIVSLPAKYTVHDIVETYVKDKLYDIEQPDDDKSHFFHFAEFIQNSFDVLLGKILLYNFERPQHEDILKKMSDRRKCEIYGATHLIRMLRRLDELMKTLGPPGVELNDARKDVKCFIRYLSKNMHFFTGRDYEPASLLYRYNFVGSKWCRHQEKYI